MPGCTVKIGFFEEAEILYQDEVAGPIVEQADKAIDLLYSKYLKAKISYDASAAWNAIPSPFPPVREAVVNAIVHKNYPSGAPIQIRVYDNRLVVGNSCILPEGWNVDDLLAPHPSEPHNPKIASVFFLAGTSRAGAEACRRSSATASSTASGFPFSAWWATTSAWSSRLRTTVWWVRDCPGRKMPFRVWNVPIRAGNVPID